MLYALADGSTVAQREGDGPLDVIFLHGWGRSGRDFTEVQRQCLAPGTSSMAIDLPGFGSSPPPTQAGGARHYASLLSEALFSDIERPVTLVGHSFGGRVAAVLAARHPGIMRGVVFTGAPLVRVASPKKAPIGYRAIRWGARHGFVPEGRLEQARQKYGSADYRAASGTMRDVLVATLAETYEEELAQLTVPTLWVWGANDADVPPLVAERASALVAGPSSVRVLAGVGHLVPTESPESLAQAVRDLA